MLLNGSNKNNRGAETQNRTGDTRIFSPLLYRLSYLGTNGDLIVSEKFVKKKNPAPGS